MRPEGPAKPARSPGPEGPAKPVRSPGPEASAERANPARPLSAGVVGRPHGLDGSFHVTRPRAELLAAAATVTIDDRDLRIERRAGTQARPILRLEGCSDRDAAERLRGRDLQVAAADTPALEPGAWWAEELEGCRVVDGNRAVGVVRRLLALPSCEALEVERDGGGELLVPLVSDAVRHVDVAAGRIDVRLEFLAPEEGK